MTKRNKTVIIGGGAWGSAIAHQLRTGQDQDYTLLVRAPATAENLRQGIVSQHPELPKLPGFQVTTDPECLRDADLVYLVVPVSAHDAMLSLIDSYTSKTCAVIFCAKGLVADAEKGVFSCMNTQRGTWMGDLSVFFPALLSQMKF